MYNNIYDYNKYNNKISLRNLNLKDKLILIGIIIAIVIVVLFVVNKVSNYYDSYAYLEKQMVKKASNYVNNQNIMILSEQYIEVSKLDIDLKKGCSVTSGVFVDRNYNYKAYLDCEDYKSDIVSNEASNYSLNGEEVIILGKDVEYNELGVKGAKQVSIQGVVGKEKGVYNLKYIVVENNKITATLIRKVVVVDDIMINNLYPNILLNGDKIEYVQKGDLYNERGISASDLVDGDLTNKVKQTGRVDVNKEGEYTIIYSVSNSRGYSSNVTRKVVVVNDFSETIISSHLSTEKKTGDSVVITLKVIGDNYAYMILPDGRKTTSKTIEYVATVNDTYNFISYDKDGKSVTKVVFIENIDNTKPSGSCVAQIHPNYTDVFVTPYSGSEIKTYVYKINGVASNETKDTSYRSSSVNINDVSVLLKNSLNNTATISCQIKYVDPSIGNTNIKYYTYSNEEYVIANTKNSLNSFVNRTANRISQNADIPNCGDLCMSFSEYHVYELQYGNMSNLSLENACGWYHSTKIKKIYTGTDENAKREALNMVYDEIFNGRVIMLQISKATEMKYRHFGVVVGYRRNVHSKEMLRAEDLIFIDAWDGKLKSLDPNHGAHWAMFSENKKGGYLVGVIKSKYYQ